MKISLFFTTIKKTRKLDNFCRDKVYQVPLSIIHDIDSYDAEYLEIMSTDS